jgi:lipid-A-disaccharide synthase-like uncharacterized protein
MELNFWIIFGLAAQGCFFLRFLIQWIYSERRKKSVIPIHFWYLSLIGGLGILIYSIHIRDIVFIAGQSMGLFVYVRNLILIYGEKRNENGKP